MLPVGWLGRPLPELGAVLLVGFVSASTSNVIGILVIPPRRMAWLIPNSGYYARECVSSFCCFFVCLGVDGQSSAGDTCCGDS